MSDPDAIQLQEFVESVTSIVETLSEFMRAMEKVVVPPSWPLLMRALVLLHSRNTFYIWLAHRIGYNGAAWWIAWHLPDSLILRLPLGWVLSGAARKEVAG